MKMLKYVLWNERDFVLFPNSDELIHSEVAARHSDNPPRSAGFVALRRDGTVKTFGASTSLLLEPSLNDAAHIAAYLKGGVVMPVSDGQKQYAERDVMELDRIGGYYIRHVGAMTAERLHAKRDIAAELAYRDSEIDRLKEENNRLRAALCQSVHDEEETHA